MPIPESMAVLNDDLRAILGRPCFACIDIVKVLRLDGVEIPTKAEDEQAVTLHWLLCLYLEHGSAWREKGEEWLKAIVDRHKQNSPPVGT